MMFRYIFMWDVCSYMRYSDRGINKLHVFLDDSNTDRLLYPVLLLLSISCALSSHTCGTAIAALTNFLYFLEFRYREITAPSDLFCFVFMSAYMRYSDHNIKKVLRIPIQRSRCIQCFFLALIQCSCACSAQICDIVIATLTDFIYLPLFLTSQSSVILFIH